MKTKNQYREKKMIEIEQIWDKYPNLAAHERLFKVLMHLLEKAEKYNDHQQLASRKELARIFDGIFLNPKTGQPTEIPALRYIDRLLTKLRKDNGYPRIRPYVQMFIETLTETGEEVIRFYVTFLRGKKHVEYINKRLEREESALHEIQEQNNELVNTRLVNKELEQYDVLLEIKNRKGKKRGKGNNN